MATGSGSNNNGQAAGGDGAAAKLQRGLLGLAAASVVITMAVSEPPPGLDGNAYFVALTAAAGVFFAGMNQVQASFWAAGSDDRRHVVGKEKKLTHALVVAHLTIVAAGLTAASLLLWVRAVQL